MGTKTKSYLDTSAFIAFLDASDSHHDLFVRLFNDPPRLLTTPLVIAEGHGWFLRRYDNRRGIQFLNFVDSLPQLKIEPVGGKDIGAAKELIKKYSDQDLTLADAVGLSLMKRENIAICWSTDRHLALGGVRLVIHE